MIFLESPWPILVVGIAAEAILAVMLIRTGRGVLLGAMAAVAAVVGIGVLIEQSVITERKQVTVTIEDAAAALEANDLPRLLKLLAPDAAKTRQEAALAMQQAEFVQVRIRNLDIHFIATTSPRTAKATFTVIATGKDRRGEVGQVTLRPFPMVVRLRLDSGRWLITDHELVEDPRGM